MNFVDLALVAMLVYAAVRGARQGAVSQVAAFGGAVAGLVAGARFAPDLAGRFVDRPGPALSLLTVSLMIAGLLLGQGLGFALGARLRAAAGALGAAPLDRLAGVVVGVGALVASVWLLASVLVQGPSATLAQQIRRSRIVASIQRTLPPAPDVVARVGTYLDEQGFPQVFAGPLGGTTAPPVAQADERAVRSAAAAGTASTVQVEATGCAAVSAGSGFVTSGDFVVTNAHVVAGAGDVSVRDRAGPHAAQVVHYDPRLDLAVLSAPGVRAPAMTWEDEAPDRGTQGATLGYAGGSRRLTVRPARVRERVSARGRDIYGRRLITREVLVITAAVHRGDSGGPFVTSDGQVGGVVFAAGTDRPRVGYALAGDRVRDDVDRATARDRAVGTGPCRF